MRDVDVIERIQDAATRHGDRPAHTYRGQHLSYAQLWSASTLVAERIAGELGHDGSPVVVYGHKEHAMLVAFLGAVRTGHPYVPIDISWPADRIASVVAESRARLVVAVRPLPHGVTGEGVKVLDGEHLARGLVPPGPLGALRPVGPDDTYYVIYTSGSTGRPKGVQIPASALAHFVDWATGLADEAPAQGVPVWLNQAPFSFDLSVMDLYCSLTTGATLHSLDGATVGNARALHDELGRSDVSVWVSTPSFADLCLADPAFDAALLPRLRTFLFCGETLSPTTAGALLDRFPDARVVNTYGPTESTVAVTSVRIGPEHLDGSALPVGRAKPGTTILIRDESGVHLPPGQAGEIVIAGDTVSTGYLHRPDLTEAAFTRVDLDGVVTPAYRTGDLGRLDADGMLHFGGRLDGQVKLHGYRIELEDIEANLRRVSGVQQAAVLAIRGEDGVVTHLHGFVQLDHVRDGSPLAVATGLKRELRTYVPDYMVPKVLTVVERIPMTPNGKADRRALEAGSR
ncbi:MAG TPA: D-alanine--poly(phosphoribitol) ligase subunit DltA [Propionibacteriaceae bacterium]|nr:D-alanine--poly(phosphoribitol) ligase subunit DltA [Propionibacteriaceae bacterium]